MSAPTAFLSGLVGPRIAARSPLAACRHRQQLGRAPVRSIVCMAALPTQDDLQSASFLESVRHAETLLGFREVTVADPKIKLLDAMLETSNGARGFFVTLLSQPDVILADQDPLPAGLQALIAKHCASETVADLIVKNVVMSTAMAEAYTRNPDAPPGLAAGSSMTATRGARIVTLAATAPGSAVPRLGLDMLDALSGSDAGAQTYTSFVAKWKYDHAQCSCAAAALRAALDAA